MKLAKDVDNAALLLGAERVLSKNWKKLKSGKWRNRVEFECIDGRLTVIPRGVTRSEEEALRLEKLRPVVEEKKDDEPTSR